MTKLTRSSNEYQVTGWKPPYESGWEADYVEVKFWASTKEISTTATYKCGCQRHTFAQSTSPTMRWTLCEEHSQPLRDAAQKSPSSSLLELATGCGETP
jgi:hypothetical protein